MKSNWQPKPPAFDGNKIFDNDDKTAKRFFLSECFAALSLSKILISSIAGGLGRLI